MRRIAVVIAVLAAFPPTASAAGSVHSWAQPQIKLVTARKVFAGTPATFRASAPLTTGTLARVLAKLTGTPLKLPHDGAAPVSMEELDRALVGALGLRDSAYRFYLGARRAGLNPPRRFGTEAVARLLGLRLNHPAGQDDLELQPQQTATRAEAAYSVAQILRFGSDDQHWGYHHHRHTSATGDSTTTAFAGAWEVQNAKEAAAAFELPSLTRWQRRIVSTAFSYIGFPYIWGGTSSGFDCSGFVWRVYKLTTYPGEQGLAGTLRGRTTMEMSGEVPRGRRINLKSLQPGDVMYFGHRGRRSKPAEVDHAAIYVGNGWLINSSGFGVALAPVSGWYEESFAWARRPLAEAGLV